MVKTLVGFGGFETGGTEEMLTVTSGVEVETTPAPPSWKEKYVCQLPKSTSGAGTFYDMMSDQVAHDNDMIFGFYVYFVAAEITGAQAGAQFFAAVEAKGDCHFSLTQDSNVLSLWDADGNLVDSVEGFIKNDTWYRFEIRFTHGDPGSVDIYVDGEEVFSATGENFDADGLTGLTGLYFKGTPDAPVGAEPDVEYWINSWYFYAGGSSVDDFLGPFEVIGPYQNRKDSVVGDFGNDLDGGTWEDSGETPGNTANFSQYTGQPSEGGVTTHIGTAPGPYMDPRVSSSDEVKAASWVFTYQGARTDIAIGLKWGVTAFNDINTDNTATTNGISSGRGLRKFIVSEATLPTKTDYFQYGMKSQNIMGASDGRLHDVWCMLLYVPGVPTVHIKGAHIKGAAIL